ncbi:MAG: protein phosphatase CheZ [Burkholderiales bacterium]
MKSDSPETLSERETKAAPTASTASTADVFLQVGSITRLLHDTLAQVGVMPKLQVAADGLPDARSRLNYIAEKTAAAADKVLNSVDQAKAEHKLIADATRQMARDIVADPVKAVATGAVMNFVGDVEASTARIDQHLTDIMLAQDFHDLTGQVVTKVVKLATELEDSLLKLLMQVIPADQVHKVEDAFLNGPVVNPEGRSDVVTNQEQVDDLLASLGF